MVVFAGCGHQAPVPVSEGGMQKNEIQVASTAESHVQPTSQPRQLLAQHFQEWSGTPYRLGGQSARGIDCSGFVNVTYNNLFGINLPRTTKEQAKFGKKIRRRKLSTGDLVFFKTGFFQRHVGIYVGNDEFIHASTSKGVIRSSLRAPYWSKHYWKSVRVTTL